MVRAFAIALGISTIRVVGLVLDVIIAPYGPDIRQAFVVALWVGWLLSVGAAELWLQSRDAVHDHRALPQR
jgi:hypothetical protein